MSSQQSTIAPLFSATQELVLNPPVCLPVGQVGLIGLPPAASCWLHRLIFSFTITSTPGVTRTRDRRFRKPLLYPAELRGQNILSIRFTSIFLRLSRQL